MSSNNSGINTSLLSPVSSPVPQARQNSYANVTGDTRRARDLAADFHELVTKWMSLNSRGDGIVTLAANIKIGQVFNVAEGEDTTGTRSLPPELGPLCDHLSEILDHMSKIESKMRVKAKTAQDLACYQQQYKSPQASSCILFSSMSLQDVAETLKTIHRDFEQELKFKRELCRQIAHAESRDIVMFYSSSWIHQPYIRTQCHDLLEALLVETGQVK